MHDIGKIDGNMVAVGILVDIIVVKQGRGLWRQFLNNPPMHLVLYLPQQGNAGAGINNAHHVTKRSAIRRP